MPKLKHEIPATFQLEAQPVDLGKKEDGPREFKMTAYTGAIFDIGFGPAVIELASLQVPAEGVPIFRQHNPELFIGRSAEIATGPPLIVSGALFEGIDEADEVARISDQGGNWQASVGIRISFAEGDISFIENDDTAHVNGQLLSGPFVLLKNVGLKESSFVPLGADSNTSAITLCDDGLPLVDQHLEVTMSTPNSPSFEDEQKRVADISSAFAQDPAFALNAITKNLSLIDAKLAWSEKLQAKLEKQAADHAAELSEREATHAAALEEAKKKKPESPAAALTGYSAGDGTDPGDHAGQFELALAAECKILTDLGSTGLARGGGLKLGRAANIRALAVQRVSRKNPELHSAYLEAHNANVASKRQGN